MPAGTLADRYGRKRILVIGLTIFIPFLSSEDSPNRQQSRAVCRVAEIGRRARSDGDLDFFLIATDMRRA
jgi:hypothetical protein